MKEERNDKPRHVAIIMDGNGRWARQRGFPRLLGHRRGAQRVVEIVRAADDLKIEVLTLYAFSAENWNRPQREVNTLMRLLADFLDAQLPDMIRHNIRFLTVGRRKPLPDFLLKKIDTVKERTGSHTGLTLVLAVNYGSRQEILDAAAAFARDAQHKREDPDKLNEEIFGRYLYTASLPDPDLLIRTSGEERVSNFLLWQISYAELYFVSKYWPDFRRHDLVDAVAEFGKRKRRFGSLSCS